MPNLNKAMLIGYVGRDPETRYTQSGTAVCNFSIATNEKWEDKEQTTWHKCVAFGRLAEICSQYVTKGMPVYVEGRIQTREWDDKDGNRRWTTEIVAKEMQMLGKKYSQQKEKFTPSPPDESDIPF